MTKMFAAFLQFFFSLLVFFSQFLAGPETFRAWLINDKGGHLLN